MSYSQKRTADLNKFVMPAKAHCCLE